MYKNPHSHAPPKPQPTSPLLPLTRHDSPPSASMFRRIMVAASSWLHTRRSRCLFLLLCSPLLLPFLCASFPLFCLAELCVRFCRRSKRRDEEDGLRRCEEGRCSCDPPEEDKDSGLLQRYLEDQLRLVGSMYDCGDEFEFGSEIERDGPSTDFRTPLLA